MPTTRCRPENGSRKRHKTPTGSSTPSNSKRPGTRSACKPGESAANLNAPAKVTANRRNTPKPREKKPNVLFHLFRVFGGFIPPKAQGRDRRIREIRGIKTLAALFPRIPVFRRLFVHWFRFRHAVSFAP